jgi:hypothetical protein
VGEPFDLSNKLELESQKGNPSLFQRGGLLARPPDFVGETCQYTITT